MADLAHQQRMKGAREVVRISDGIRPVTVMLVSMFMWLTWTVFWLGPSGAGRTSIPISLAVLHTLVTFMSELAAPGD